MAQGWKAMLRSWEELASVFQVDCRHPLLQAQESREHDPGKCPTPAHTQQTRPLPAASCEPRAAPQAFSCLKHFTERGMGSSIQQPGGVGWEPSKQIPLYLVGPGVSHRQASPPLPGPQASCPLWGQPG